MLNLVTQNAHFQGICFISSGQICSLHSYYVKPILWFLKVICPLNISPSEQTLGDGSPLDCYRTDNSSSKCHQMSKIRHFRRNDFSPWIDPIFQKYLIGFVPIPLVFSEVNYCPTYSGDGMISYLVGIFKV